MNMLTLRRFFWIVGPVLVLLALAFIAGGQLWKAKYASRFQQEFEKENAHVLLGHYIAYRNISIKIKEKSITDAQCRSDLYATAMLNSLSTCLKSNICKDSIGEKIALAAPEVLAQEKVPFVVRNSCP